MNTIKTFSNKNLLFLFPTGSNQYRNNLYTNVKNMVKNIYLVDFCDYTNRKGIKNTEDHIKNMVKQNNIDIIMSFPFASEFQLSVEFYASLRKMAKLVFWLFDDEMYLNSYDKYYAQAADAVVTTDCFSFHEYKKLNVPPVLFLPSYSKEVYHLYSLPKDIDVSFVGNSAKADRKELITYLSDNGINVQSFGRGTGGGFVPWEEYPKIFSRSKINLNFTKHDGITWVNKNDPLIMRARQAKGRPIEIAMTGSFCLSEYASSLSCMFDVGKEIDTFNTKEEMLEKIRYYLAHEKERENIAHNAYLRALKDYESYINIGNVFDQLEKSFLENNAAKDAKIYLNSEFKTNSINGLTFTMFVMLWKGSKRYVPETFMQLFRYGSFAFIKGFLGGMIRVIANRLNLILSIREN